THIIALAARHRLPAIYQWSEHVKEGGLMAYGASLRGLYRRVAALVDRIFKGADPATLPVEQATELVLAVNLKTAKALGLTIPPAVLARAGEIPQWWGGERQGGPHAGRPGHQLPHRDRSSRPPLG